MTRRGLQSEILRCLFFLAAAGLVGLIVGRFATFICLAALAYLGRLFFLIYRLEDWINLARRGSEEPNKEELTGIWRDIAYDVQLMMARHEKERSRLQMVVKRVQEMTSALTDAVILIDAKGNIEWWNRAAEKLFNFRKMDQGHKLTNLIRHPSFIQYFDHGEYQAPLEITMWRNQQHLEFQVHVFGDKERLVIARDITRLFKLEQMRKDFVANVSHELRTPLTVIKGYIETLADYPKIPPVWHKALQQMDNQTLRMTTLINDLIILSKLETDQKETSEEPVHIAPLIDTIIIDASKISAERNHRFDVGGDSDLGIIGNKNELRSAISNLVINALNYSPDGSEIVVRYTHTPSGATISIADHGIGIDPKHIPRLTERFYRVDAGRSVATGGTGLGLAIVKHILLRHNSELRIESQLGKGSKFACLFPESIVTRVADVPSANRRLSGEGQ